MRHFLFAPFRFFPILIKFTFLIFPDPSGRVEKFFPNPGNGEKLAGSFKKKIKSIRQQELFLEPKQEKRYLIIYRGNP